MRSRNRNNITNLIEIIAHSCVLRVCVAHAAATSVNVCSFSRSCSKCSLGNRRVCFKNSSFGRKMLPNFSIQLNRFAVVARVSRLVCVYSCVSWARTYEDNDDDSGDDVRLSVNACALAYARNSGNRNTTRHTSTHTKRTAHRSYIHHHPQCSRSFAKI